MKRLIKNNAVEIRNHIIPTTPVYNPLGKGNLNQDEFSTTDNKSYTKMMNEKHKSQHWTNDKGE